MGRDASPTAYGFLYSGGSYTTLSVPGAVFTDAWGINDAGQIVGAYKGSGGIIHGFLYSGGTYTTLSPPGAILTEAWGINDADQIVGYYLDSSGYHGFLDAGGKYTNLDDPLGTDGGTQAYGINNAGQILRDNCDLSRIATPAERDF